MSPSEKAKRDLANADLIGQQHVNAAIQELKTTLTGPIPKWVSQDQLWLPASMSSWDVLARVLEYDSQIWHQLIKASTKTILYVMALLRSFVRASSVKITDELVDLDTWARLKYRVACHQQLLDIVRLRMSSEELTELNHVICKDDIIAVYVPTCTTVYKYIAKYFSAGVPAPVAEDSSSNSSVSPSAPPSVSLSAPPYMPESSANETPTPPPAGQVCKDGWTKAIFTSDGSNSSAGPVVTRRVKWRNQSVECSS